MLKFVQRSDYDCYSMHIDAITIYRAEMHYLNCYALNVETFGSTDISVYGVTSS